MRKLLLILIFVPISVFAKFREGIITFNDNTTKKGFIYVPDYPQESNLKFRLEENGKTEKFEINSVKGFEIINDQNETIQYITLNLDYLDDLTFSKKKSWVRIVKKGKITLCAIDKLQIDLSTFPFFLNPHIVSSYYIKKQNQEIALFFNYMYGSEGHWNFNIGGFNQLKDAIQKHFGEECPKLADLIDREDLKKNGIVRIVELYDQNCGQ